MELTNNEKESLRQLLLSDKPNRELGFTIAYAQGLTFKDVVILMAEGDKVNMFFKLLVNIYIHYDSIHMVYDWDHFRFQYDKVILKLLIKLDIKYKIKYPHKSKRKSERIITAYNIQFINVLYDIDHDYSYKWSDNQLIDIEYTIKQFLDELN